MRKIAQYNVHLLVAGVIFSTLLCAILISCGKDRIKEDHRNGDQTEYQKLKEQILKLEGTVAMINNFVASDYATCDSGSLPAFETKICRIAQTSSAEQQVILAGQLNRVASIMQEDLYGPDCINSTDPGCPVAGSILDDLSVLDPNDITALQSDVSQLQSDLTNLETRMDNFNGSGNSIEVVIAGIESDLTNLEGRVDDIEAVLGGSDYYEWIFVCHDVTSVNEPILLRGDGLEVKGYVNSSTNNGLGQIALAGSSGDQYLTTDVKPKCKFKIYDLTTNLKICWNNSNRSASEVSIDTECDFSGSFSAPTVNCTCEN